MTAPLLRAHGLRVEYPTPGAPVVAVDGLDLYVDRHEVVGLVGVSGSGKSTAALALLGLVRPPGEIVAGEVWYGDQNLLALPDDELRRIRGRSLSLIVQSPRAALNPMLTVGRQLVNVIRAHMDVPRAQAQERAEEMLGLVGINDPRRRLAAYPHELSGGMAQRVLIAMALACAPELLIADEPTSGLDVTIQAQILDDLLRTVQETGSAALIVTQDFGVVANYCDRVLVLYGGQLVESVGVVDFFASVGHPSAEALLSSQRDGHRVRLHGPPIDLRSPPPGCYLSPRCPWAVDGVCTGRGIPLREVAPGHLVRCDRWEQIRDEVQAARTAGVRR